MSALGELLDEARRDLSAVAADVLPDVCTVRRATTAQGTSGGTRPTYSALHEDVPCRFDAKPRSGASTERMTGGAVTAFVDGELTLPYIWQETNVVIQPRDRIVVTGRSERPDRTFEVVSPGDGSTSIWQTCLVVMRG